MLAFSEEVLVTKSDLDEKTSQMSDLTNKVEEMRTHHGYQMRLKDKDLKDKITLLTDKFTAEIEGEKQRYETLAAEKNDMELEYEDRIKNMDERHAAATQQTEAQYQHKIMAEVERYQQLMEEKELLNERWDEQNSLLVESHERLVQEPLTVLLVHSTSLQKVKGEVKKAAKRLKRLKAEKGNFLAA